MHRLRRFVSPVDAMLAAMQLWRNGIVARVHSTPPEADFSPNGLREPFELLIVSREDEAVASRLIEELDETNADFELGWEDEASVPDVSRLDPVFAPPCPACDRLLPLRTALDRCPACGDQVDVVQELLTRHGPEIFDGCYVAPASLLAEEDLRLAAIPCARCEYTLANLTPVGHCPECGSAYDKAAMIQSWLME